MALIRQTNLLSYIVSPKDFGSQKLRNVHRWVSPTMRELKVRREKFKTDIRTPRNTFIEWNYNSEIFAFGKRLNEEFKMENLQRAFVHRSYIVQEELKQQKLGIENPNIQLEDNKKSIEVGEHLVADYVKSFLYFSLPKCSETGISIFYNWLISEKNLAKISAGLGTKDLIMCSDENITEKILADTLIAIVGALMESSGEERAYYFIRDFICTQLNQIDLTEVWEIEKPLNVLQKYCTSKSLKNPEPRLLGDCGKNTVLAAYHIGIYSNKNLLGKGFGESLRTAIDTAAADALYKLYGINENSQPFNFEIKLEKNNDKNKIKKVQ